MQALRHTNRSRGVSMVEMVVTAMVLSFIVAATFGVYNSGRVLQRRSQFYSTAQTDLRVALRCVTKSIRSSLGVVTSATFDGAAQSSGANQVVLLASPDGTTEINLRYYVTGGVLYAQRSDQGGAGTVIVRGVTSIVYAYYATAGGVRSAAGGPSQATEVQVTIRLRSGSVESGIVGYAAIRSRVASS